tara:strand:- start:190 stop:342 length:153 start_codon:yes stop_codon:yes gene_type:complete
MSMRKELEEELIELRSDINKYKKMGWEYHLEDTLVRFSEIETELEELHHE